MEEDDSSPLSKILTKIARIKLKKNTMQLANDRTIQEEYQSKEDQAAEAANNAGTHWNK